MSPYISEKCALYLRQWIEFHAAPSYRSLGDMERSVSTRHDRFDLDSLFTLQKCAVGKYQKKLTFEDFCQKWDSTCP
jgi:hypothetical protein